MANQDYCEIILNAVSKIVTAEMAEKENQGMIVCQIKDNTEGVLGRYSVTHKGDTFVATAEATDYAIGDEVYVLRAKAGDTGLSVIVGRKLRKDEFPIQINDPLTKMMRLKEWKPSDTTSAIYEVTPSAPYDTLGLSFDAVGEFTITLNIVNTLGRTYVFKLDEKDFLFSSNFDYPLTQRCTIDISRVGTPLRVNLTTTGMLSNFTIDFGYNITNKLESDKALKLYTENEQKYYSDSFGNIKENPTVNLYLDWLYLDENAEIKSLTYINYLENKPLGFDVYWYKQVEGADGDFYSGPGWTKIEPVGEISSAETEVLAKDNNLFALSGGEKALFSGDLTRTAIKAVIIYTPIGATSVEIIASNELVFENIQDEPLEYITRGSIELSDGSNAVYPLWGLHGFLKDQNDVFKERQFNFSYTTGLGVEALYKNIASVTWYIPKANMYYFSGETRIYSTAIQSLEGEYAVLTIIPSEKDNQGNILTGKDVYKTALKEIFRADYKLMERYITNRISNKVICEINFKDETETWKQERDLYFSKAGLDGTGSQILIWLTDQYGNLARNVQPGEISYTVHTLFIDENGNEVNTVVPDITLQKGMSSAQGQGKYNSYTYISPTNFVDDNGALTYCDVLKVVYTVETTETKLVDEIIYEFNAENNTIVKTETTKEVVLKPPTTYIEYYPISCAFESSYGYEGPTYITYDSSGKNLNYDNVELGLWIDNKKFTDPDKTFARWRLIYEVEDEYMDALPQLKPYAPGMKYSTIDQKAKLYPAAYYESNIDYIVSIVIEHCPKGTYWQVLYIQPLIIRQARHFSTILDNWDGNFKIDADGNYVLSSALVAGNKEGENNTFNGIIAGTLNTIMEVEVPFTSLYPIDKDGNPIMTDDDGNSLQEDTIVYRTNTIYRENQTGILGYKDGKQTYGFLDDGTAFIGPSGKGQILVNGTDGKIKSGNTFVQARRDSKTGVITTEGTGMVIDFANGGIYAPNFILDPNGDASFAGRISAFWGTIGGYNIASRMLYASKGENNYMALLSPSYKSAKYDISSNLDEYTKDNWYYQKKGETAEEAGEWLEYPDIPHIENQAGPGLIIENNKRRLRALFNETSQQPQYMVDWYSIDNEKEKNLGSVAIGWERTTTTNSYYPGLFGEGILGHTYKLGVTGKEVVEIQFATGQTQKEEVTGTFFYMKNMKPVYVENSSPPIIDRYVVGSETLIGNNKLLFSSDKQISSFGIKSFWSGNVEFAKTIPYAEATDGGWVSALSNLQPKAMGVQIGADEFTSVLVGENSKTFTIWQLGQGTNGLKAERQAAGATTGTFEVSMPMGKLASYFKWTPANKQGEFLLKSNGTNKSSLSFKGQEAFLCGLNIKQEITSTEVIAYNTLTRAIPSETASSVIFGGDGTDSSNTTIDTEVVTTGRIVYIGTDSSIEDSDNEVTDKIIFTVPVEFSRETDGDTNTTGGVILSNITPVFNSKHEHDGLLVQNTQTNTWAFIHGSGIMGGNGVLKSDTYNRYYTEANANKLYNLSTNGLAFVIRKDDYNVGYFDSSYNVNQLIISNYQTIDEDTGNGTNLIATSSVSSSRLWTSGNQNNSVALDITSGLELINGKYSCELGYDSSKQNYTLTTDTAFIIDAPSLDMGETISLKSDGTGKLKVADFTYYGENGLSIGSSSGSYTITTDTFGLVINGALDATTLYENSESLQNIYLKKKLLRLDDNYKNIIGFDQTYYVNGGDNSGGYTNYYTLSDYGAASKVTINADGMTYYYLNNYEKGQYLTLNVSDDTRTYYYIIEGTNMITYNNTKYYTYTTSTSGNITTHTIGGSTKAYSGEITDTTTSTYYTAGSVGTYYTGSIVYRYESRPEPYYEKNSDGTYSEVSVDVAYNRAAYVDYTNVYYNRRLTTGAYKIKAEYKIGNNAMSFYQVTQ